MLSISVETTDSESSGNQLVLQDLGNEHRVRRPGNPSARDILLGDQDGLDVRGNGGNSVLDALDILPGKVASEDDRLGGLAGASVRRGVCAET